MAKFNFKDRVMTPDGPGTVIHEEGADMVSMDMSAVPDELMAELHKRVVEIEDVHEPVSPELSALFSKALEYCRPAYELDGMVEVELDHVVGPASLRHYRPDDLKLL